MIQPTDNFCSPSFNNSNKVGPAKPKPVCTSDRLDPEVLRHLGEAIAKEPVIRPELVELGRKLSADPGYPPEHVVEKLAELLSQDFDEDAV